jgi:hypothetical protein
MRWAESGCTGVNRCRRLCSCNGGFLAYKDGFLVRAQRKKVQGHVSLLSGRDAGLECLNMHESTLVRAWFAVPQI